MKEFKRVLEQEMNQLEQNIKVLEKRVDQYPPGVLQIGHCKGTTQYYYRDEHRDQTGKRSHYIKKEDRKLAELLAQKDYDQKLLKNMTEKYRCLKATLGKYEQADYVEVYEKLHQDRKQLVTPFYISNEDYAKQWQEAAYQKKPFTEGTAELYTVKGERVRSKSEKILADFFEREGIPYRYEYPVKLMGNQIIHPDFMLLNVRTRKEYYLEHLGMTDDPKYIADAISRLEEMAKCGIVVGKNLLLTMETKNHPLNMIYVQKMIKQNLY